MKDMRQDHDARQLSELLRRAVPESPDPTGRADQVVQRGRHANRRRGTLSAVALAAAAMVVIVAPHYIPGSPVSGSSTAVGPAGPMPAHPFTCPSPGRPAAPAMPEPGGTISAGAVLARICPAADRIGVWSPPLDALTTNVGDLAALFNSLPVATGTEVCTLEATTDDYSMTFQYSNGRLVRLDGVNSGCGFITMSGHNGVTRLGAPKVLSAYVDLLARQRMQQLPPGSAPPASCPTRKEEGTTEGGILLPMGPELGLVNAVICEYPARVPGERSPATRSGVLSPRQVHVVSNNYRARATRHPKPIGTNCADPSPPPILIVGHDAWGDTVLLRRQCVGYNRFASGPWYWTPSPAVEAMLQSVLRG